MYVVTPFPNLLHAIDLSQPRAVRRYTVTLTPRSRNPSDRVERSVCPRGATYSRPRRSGRSRPMKSIRTEREPHRPAM
jgi:hypothetical protein